MSVMAVLILLCVVGAVSSVVASRPTPLRTNKTYHLIHFLLTFYLIFVFWKVFWAGAGGGGDGVLIDFFCHVALLLIAVSLQSPFLYFVLSHYATEWLPGLLMSDDRLRMPKTYDRAEKAERAKDFAQALQLFREAVARDPEDMEARRRVAELHVKLGDYDAAIADFAFLVSKTAELDQRGPLVVRLSEMLVQHKHDQATALEYLYKLRDDAAGTRHAEYIQARIDALAR